MNKRQLTFGVGIVAILVALFTWNLSYSNRGNNTSNNNRQSASNPAQSSESSASSSSQEEGLASTSTETASLESESDPATGKDVLVVYFSRKEGVWNGPLEEGNTARLAHFIEEATNADTYEIIPVEDYPEEYEATAEQAREEQRVDARPAIANPLPDVSKYKTIFIGAPVWWSEYPMIVRTFLDAKADDLQDKTLVPFTTHEGSGLGSTQRQLQSQFPNARVLNGFSVRGDDAISSQERINAWLREIGVIN